MWTFRAALASAALVASACRTNPPDYPSSSDPGLAAGTAVAAGVAWVAVGCKFQGCPYGSYCDKTTGYCKEAKCSDGCPENTFCNEGLNRCQDVPPAQGPTDRLPQDDARNAPGVH